MLLNILLQVTQTATEVASTSSPAVTQKTLNIFDLAVKGGWIMIVLAILSIVAVYIFVDRYLALNKAAKEDDTFWLTLNSHHPYSKKDIEQYAIDCDTALFDGRQEACRNLNLQHQFFRHLAMSIKQGHFKDTTFIIVG